MTVYKSLRGLAPSGKRTCVALGLFDGLHLGHRAVVGAAVGHAGERGLLPCVFTFTFDGDRPPASKTAAGRLLTPGLRDALLGEMGAAAVFCPPFGEFRGLTAGEFVRGILRDKLRAAAVFCGENYRFGKNASGAADDLRALCAEEGIAVETVPLVYLDGGPVSSTRIRDCLACGDMPLAERLLGRPFAIDFEVIHGRKLGRTLDSPTINQPFPDGFARPGFGVYATLTTVGGRRHVSVTNVGFKPTVGSDRLLSETYIQGFHGDLYGRNILVEFLRFIRPERRFGSVEELRGQIARDHASAEKIGRGYLTANPD